MRTLKTHQTPNLKAKLRKLKNCKEIFGTKISVFLAVYTLI